MNHDGRYSPQVVNGWSCCYGPEERGAIFEKEARPTDQAEGTEKYRDKVHKGIDSCIPKDVLAVWLLQRGTEILPAMPEAKQHVDSRMV